MSLVRFLIEELGVPHIIITTIQHDSQPVNLPHFPLLPHRDSNHQNPAAQISSIQLVIPGIWSPSGAMGPKKYSVVVTLAPQKFMTITSRYFLVSLSS
ncbi:hypothetical protein AVEN_233854-1 [Araneus ventricosus]|uniref:Uncharacterized protein n=1 Tax=Araneus ventricosus TaxID=182803 RepID=A0A4Y2LET2_ARAVE|nr:hypothetical protein AVEN_168186-1 [Araneus ventricosus]GBO01076.1 hypothetical protein AVEN_233854-1 [Araneus ventricosus]